MHQRARGAFFLPLCVFSLFILNFSQSLFYIFSFSPPFPVLYYDKVAQRKLRRYRHKGQIIPPLAVIPFLRRVVHYGKNQAASPLRRSNSGRIRPGPAGDASLQLQPACRVSRDQHRLSSDFRRLCGFQRCARAQPPGLSHRARHFLPSASDHALCRTAQQSRSADLSFSVSELAVFAQVSISAP